MQCCLQLFSFCITNIIDRPKSPLSQPMSRNTSLFLRLKTALFSPLGFCADIIIDVKLMSINFHESVCTVSNNPAFGSRFSKFEKVGVWVKRNASCGHESKKVLFFC